MCFLVSSDAASIPATSEHSCLASFKLEESSLAFVKFQPNPRDGHTLPTTNPSEFLEVFRAHALSFT